MPHAQRSTAPAAEASFTAPSSATPAHTRAVPSGAAERTDAQGDGDVQRCAQAERLIKKRKVVEEEDGDDDESDADMPPLESDGGVAESKAAKHAERADAEGEEQKDSAEDDYTATASPRTKPTTPARIIADDDDEAAEDAEDEEDGDVDGEGSARRPPHAAPVKTATPRPSLKPVAASAKTPSKKAAPTAASAASSGASASAAARRKRPPKAELSAVERSEQLAVAIAEFEGQGRGCRTRGKRPDYNVDNHFKAVDLALKEAKMSVEEIKHGAAEDADDEDADDFSQPHDGEASARDSGPSDVDSGGDSDKKETKRKRKPRAKKGSKGGAAGQTPASNTSTAAPPSAKKKSSAAVSATKKPAAVVKIVFKKKGPPLVTGVSSAGATTGGGSAGTVLKARPAVKKGTGSNLLARKK